MFKGILIEKDEAGYRASLTDIDEGQLPAGDVTVRVSHSTLNYKDGLAITGKGPVVRRFPMVPGIDLVGTVEQTTHPEYKVGDAVVLNGWGVGEVHWGGLAQKARLNGNWLVPLPAQFTPQQAMGIGTAGYTAMLCVLALERHGVKPEHGEILVTGAAGGVGSVATAVLTKLGYTVVAVSGRPEESDYIKSLGAVEILDRALFSSPGKPLGKERWAGAVDVVGSHTLANVCATTKYRGVVTACGLAGGMDFPASVAPFILRAITLAGIDSVMCPRPDRLEAWRRLGSDLDIAKLGMISKEIGLNDAISHASKLLNGEIKGRVVVDVKPLIGSIGGSTFEPSATSIVRRQEMRKKMLGVVLGCTLGGLQAQAAEFRCQDDVPVVNYSRHEQRLVDQFWDETLTYLDQYLGALKTPTGHCKDSAEATIQTYDSKTGKQQTRCIMKYRDMQLLAKHVKAVLAEPDKAKACFDPQKDYMAFPLYTPSKTVQALSPVSKWINRPLLTDYFEKIGGDISAAGLELNKNFLAVTSRTDTGKHFRKDVSANTLENPRGESTHHDGEDSRNHFSSNRSEYPRGGWTPDAREHSGKDFGENTSEHPRGGWNPHSSEQFSKDVSIRGLPTLWSSVGWIPFYAENADAGSERFRGGYLYAEVMGPWGNLRIKDIDGETVGAEIGMTVQLFNTFYPFHYHHPQEIYMTLTKPQCIDQNKYMVIHWDSDEFKHQRVENGWTVEIDGSDGRWQQWFANQDPNKEWLTYFERNAIHAFNALEGCNQTIENSGLVTVWARSTSQDNEQSTRLCRNAEGGKLLMPGDKAVCDLHDWVAK